MEDKAESSFCIFSKKLQEEYKKGDWLEASKTLQGMATILKIEKKYTDELKTLILAYYYDMSGAVIQPFISDDLVDNAKEAYSRSGMSESDLTFLYFDTVRNDTMPIHSLTLRGSFRVFLYCLLGKKRKIEEVLNNLAN